MTTLDQEPSAGADDKSSKAGSRRRSMASTALALAILVAVGVAVGVLVNGGSSAPSDTPSDAPPAPAAAAPPAPASSPAPSPAPPSASAPPASTDAPAVTDTSGAPLPAPVADGVRSAFTALSAGNVGALQGAYVPSRTVRAAPWPTVAGLLQVPANRTAVLATLRSAPTRTPDGYRYATPDGNQVGVDAQGHIGYLRIS